MIDPPSDSIPISEFKATCLAVLERVRRTGTSVVVTRHGEPIAEIVPLTSRRAGASWIGAMQGTAVFVDDLIEPASPPHEWEVLRP
jgi:prevent-host-death family protein